MVAWVKLAVGPGDRERMHEFFAAARTGQALPAPVEPPAEP